MSVLSAFDFDSIEVSLTALLSMPCLIVEQLPAMPGFTMSSEVLNSQLINDRSKWHDSEDYVDMKTAVMSKFKESGQSGCVLSFLSVALSALTDVTWLQECYERSQ